MGPMVLRQWSTPPMSSIIKPRFLHSPRALSEKENGSWLSYSFSKAREVKALQVTPCVRLCYLSIILPSLYVLAMASPWLLHGSDIPPRPIDFGLGHMTCFDQWDVRGGTVQVPSWDLKRLSEFLQPSWSFCSALWEQHAPALMEDAESRSETS